MSLYSIVTLVPVPLSRDTRSLKIAGTFLKYGMGSIAVEARPSESEWRSPVKLISYGTRKVGKGKKLYKSQRPKSRLPDWLAERAHFMHFLFRYWIILPLWGIFVVPKADCYYLHEFRLFPMAWLLHKIRRIPIVYDAHDLYPEVWNKNELSKFWLRRFLPFLEHMERVCAHRAAAVITVSPGVAECMERRFGVPVNIIRNCHDESIEGEVTESIRDLLSIPDDAFLIVSIGNDKAGHNGITVLQLLAKLDEKVHIAFIGSFHEEKRLLAEQLGISPRVHLPGNTASNEVVPFVRDADMAILPYEAVTANYRYILPNGFFQSLAAGLPLLYTKMPEILGAIGDKSIGVVINFDDLEETARKISMAISDQETMTRFKINAMDLGRDLSWQNEEKKLINIVFDAMDQSPAEILAERS